MALTIPTEPEPSAAQDLRRLRAMLRRDRRARSIARSWRALTGGRCTVIACSGGADSTALLLALWAAEPEQMVAAHIVHDMRPPAEAGADREVVAALADCLGLSFLESEVRISPGNVEAEARRARHSALGALARQANAGAVAMGHHADDQLETILMRLARGAGPRGLGGIPARRRLDREAPPVSLVRPMLHLAGADAEAICRLAGVSWREDATNQDRSRLRADIRSGAAAALRDARPRAAHRAAEAAELLQDAARLIEDRALAVFGDRLAWPRQTLRAERAIVIGAGLRRAAASLTKAAGRDRLSRRRIRQIISAIQDGQTRERVFDMPERVQVIVGAKIVRMEREPSS